MTTPTTLGSGTLALAPPFVRGATQPVIGAHIGIALAILDLVIDGLGAYVDIDPAPAGTVNSGDTCKLWLDGDPAPLDTKTVSNPNVRLEMRIGKGRLNSAKVNKLYYTYERGSQNIGTSTPLLEALYNNIRPGLKDTRPDIDGHSELVMTLSDEIKNGVGPGFVSGQVCFSYPYCRAYDTITLKCNGEIIKFTVGKNEAPEPPDPGSAIPTTVCFIIDRPFLDSAARPSGVLDFSYTVTDQVGNTPDTDAVWSATQTVDEDLAGNRFPAAIYREKTSDPTDESGIIDLEKLGNKQLQIIIRTDDKRLNAGDTINADCITKVDGKPDVSIPLSGKIEADEFGQKKALILLLANAIVVAANAINTVYEVLRGDVLIGQSVAATARVIGTGLPVLLEPRLQKSGPDGFDPTVTENHEGGNLQAEVLGSVPGDAVRMVVKKGAPGWIPPVFADKDLNTNHRANYAVDSELICANMGQWLEILYEFIRDGKRYDSQLLKVFVKKIPDFHPLLPVGTIDGNTGETLNVSQLTAASEILWSAWIHQVLGQKAWLWCEGVNNKDQAVVHHVLQGVALDAGPGLKKPVPLGWLQALKHGSALKIFLRLNFSGKSDEADLVEFPVRDYTVEAAPALIVDTTPFTLSGQNYTIDHEAVGWIRTGDDLEGTATTRAASGGVPPYIYTSSDPTVVSVDDTGRIRSENNGSAIITVKDSANQEKTIQVTASNVRTILYNLSPMNNPQAAAWVRSINGVFFPIGDPGYYLTVDLDIKYRPVRVDYYWHTGVMAHANCFYIVEFYASASKRFFKMGNYDRTASAICFKQ